MRRLFAVSVQLVAVGLLAGVYAHFTFFDLEHARWIALGLEERPYVYRALVPAIAHVLVIMGVRPDVALTMLIIVSAIGLMYGLIYFAKSFRWAIIYMMHKEGEL